MPRGIPKNRTNGITKMEGVRRALTRLGADASPKDIQPYLKSEFDIDMDTSMISNYKSGLKAAGRSALIHRPARARATPHATEGITLEEIRVVKAVVDKVGADKVRQLAEVLGK